MTTQATIRQITHDDAPAYRQLRLQALQKNPQAFLATFKTEELRPDDHFVYELSAAIQPPIWGYYGLFVENKLIGFCQIGKSYLDKKQHLAYLYNLYVDPDYRGQGHAKKLTNYVLNKLKELKIERVFITYLAKNKCVRGFYDHLGFEECGIKPEAVKDGDEYDDEIEMTLKL
jgi:ribosomal protein S18 acetylase RimI-like enzyme